MRGPSLVAASGGHSSSRCVGPSSRPLLLRSTGSRRAGSVIVAHRPSCSMACGILPDQGSNPCPLHWQADSQPLRHQGSPAILHILVVTNDLPMYALKKLHRSTLQRHLETAVGSPGGNYNTQHHCHFQWGLVFLWRLSMKAAILSGQTCPLSVSMFYLFIYLTFSLEYNCFTMVC